MNQLEKSCQKPGPKPREPLNQSNIQGLKYSKLIRNLLKSLHDHADCPNRRLHYDQLGALIIMQYFNPVLTSLRSVQQASGLRNVQRKLGVRRTSLGSLSESSRVFEPTLLKEIVEELAGRTAAVDAPARPAGLAKELDVIAVDGSLIEALPRMAWALWLDKEHRAVKLHLEFDLLRGVPKRDVMTDGNANEKQVLRDQLEADKLYVLDAGYRNYEFFETIIQAGSSFVVRLQDNAVYKTLEERPLTEADRKSGILFDRVVRLGSKAKRDELSAPVRVVKVHVVNPPHQGLARRRSKVSSKKTFRHRPTEYDLYLVTDRLDLLAETIALLYRYPWTIELFFRWFKCVLKFNHLLFESQRGIEILVYCALIASLLITLWTGRKPTKRTLEMVQLYFQGWAELDELEAHIARLKRDDE